MKHRDKRNGLSGIVLAEGEATGHVHVAVGDVKYVEEQAEVAAPSGFEVTHQEHDVVTLPPDVYTRRIAKETDQFTQESHDVAD